MKNKSCALYILFLIISIVDLYLNYNEKDFPEYHEKRVKYNICNIFISLVTILFLISAFCHPCCLCLNFMLLIIIVIAAFYYEISSFYLYFNYDGSKKIKSFAIRFLMWISFINFSISLFLGCSGSRSSTISDNRDSNNIELEEQIV